MRQPLMLLILLALAGSLTAQVITSRNIPRPGSNTFHNPFRVNSLQSPSPGPDQTWLYTNVSSDGSLITADFNLPEVLPQGVALPGASTVSNAIDGYRMHYRPNDQLPHVPMGFFAHSSLISDSTGLYSLGNSSLRQFFVTETGDSIFFSALQAPFIGEPELIVPFGLELGGEIKDLHYRQVYMGIRRNNGRADSFMVVRHIHKHFMADASGQLATTAAYYPNVIRLRTDIHAVDSVFMWRRNRRAIISAHEVLNIHPTVYTYWSPDHQWNVLTTVYNGNDAVAAMYQTADTRPYVSFNTFYSHAKESDGALHVGITRSQTSAEPVTVHFSTNIPADHPNFEGLLTPEMLSVTFAPNELHQTLMLPILDDSARGHNMDYVISIDSIEGPALTGAITRNIFTLMDDDRPFVNFSGNTDVLIRETNTRIDLPISMSYALNEDVVIHLHTMPKTARANQDFVPIHTSITLRAGQTSTTFPFLLLDDAFLEDTVTVVVHLSGISENAVIGMADTIRFQILDDDFRPNVGFFLSDTTVTEATNQPFNAAAIAVRLSYPLQEAITAHISPKSARNGYIFNDTLVTFQPGQTSAIIQLLILNDTLAEGTQDIDLTVSQVSENAQINRDRATIRVTVVDNDPSKVEENPPLGLGFETNAAQLGIYPNPTANSMTWVNTPQSWYPLQLTLTNNLGQVLVQYSVQQPAERLPVNLPAAVNGVYHLQIQGAQGVSSGKILLNR
jgi:hypothetical protein